MNLEASLDSLHARVVSNPWLRRFTAFIRGLLASGFIVPGLTKALGGRFTNLPLENPVGYFFDAMYRTGGYWRFIGVSQLVAAALLLMPRSGPTLGALFFLPIILNIFVITVAVGFDGTWVITGFMLLAVLYLVCWDYPRWKGVLFEPVPGHGPVHPAAAPVPWTLTLVTALGVQGVMGVLTSLRAPGSPKSLASLGMLALAVVLPLVLRARRRVSLGSSTGW